MKLTVKEMVLFGVLGAMMLTSKVLMEPFPNIHLLGVFTISITAVFRKKALYPIYVYVFLNGLLMGFPLWWIPHLYLWTALWGATMLVPKKLSKKKKAVLYTCLCTAHGLLYGTLYAPAQAILFGLNFKGMIAWIIAGFPFDAIHGVSNFFISMLIMPFTSILERVSSFHRKKPTTTYHYH
jgi:energy-coupling factor transport system substrate-specific component